MINDWPNKHKYRRNSNILYPTQSSPLPLSNSPIRQHRSSTASDRRTTITHDLGNLDPEEQAALQADINARKAARRASKRYTSYSEGEDDDHNSLMAIGTRVSEGHRNYQLM